MEELSMFEKVKTVLVNELGVDESKITMDANIIDDLGADSLSVMQIIMALEDEFHLTVDDDDVRSLLTVKAICEYLEKHVK